MLRYAVSEILHGGFILICCCEIVTLRICKCLNRVEHLQSLRVRMKIMTNESGHLNRGSQILLAVAGRLNEVSVIETKIEHCRVHPNYEIIHPAADMICQRIRSIVAGSHRQSEEQLRNCYILTFAEEH